MVSAVSPTNSIDKMFTTIQMPQSVKDKRKRYSLLPQAILSTELIEARAPLFLSAMTHSEKKAVELKINAKPSIFISCLVGLTRWTLLLAEIIGLVIVLEP